MAGTMIAVGLVGLTAALAWALSLLSQLHEAQREIASDAEAVRRAHDVLDEIQREFNCKPGREMTMVHRAAVALEMQEIASSAALRRRAAEMDARAAASGVER